MGFLFSVRSITVAASCLAVLSFLETIRDLELHNAQTIKSSSPSLRKQNLVATVETQTPPQHETSLAASHSRSLPASPPAPPTAHDSDLQRPSDEGNNPLPTPLDSPKVVFCYGDSLTAGYSPPEQDVYPYAPVLQEALGASAKFQSNPPAVWWNGHVGWTSAMLRTEPSFADFLTNEQTQRQAKRKNSNTTPQGSSSTNDSLVLPPPVDLAIVLAGTNDLAQGISADTIFESIRGIHEMAREKGSPTIALGIPTMGFLPMGWWQNSLEDTLEVIHEINQKLQSWAASTEHPKTTYVPFPIQSYDESSGFWAPDALHLTESGYEMVGKSLAPIVEEILWNTAEVETEHR